MDEMSTKAFISWLNWMRRMDESWKDVPIAEESSTYIEMSMKNCSMDFNLSSQVDGEEGEKEMARIEGEKTFTDDLAKKGNKMGNLEAGIQRV